MSDELTMEERPASEIHCLEPVGLKEPLRSDQHIRLLLFRPMSADDPYDVLSNDPGNVPLYCDIFQASLEDLKPIDRPAFAALSYRWGEPEKRYTVHCGDLQVKIHRNLYAALTEAMFTDRPRLIWTDGLCIDQDNATEKSKQVARMSDVYRNAHVVIFLGHSIDLEADRKVIACLSLFAKIHAAFQEHSIFDNIDKVRFADLKRKAAIEAKKAGLGRLEDLPWLDIRSFFTRPYWKRKWIVQEVSWAWSHEVHFDQWLIPLGCLLQSVEIIKRFEAIAKPLIYDSSEDTNQLNDLMNDPDNVELLLTGIASEYEDRIPIVVSTYDTRELVASYGNRECSDPRDHIYAIASLFPPGTDYPVDYSLSAAEVFIDFAVHCFRKYNDLILLGSCGRRSFWRDPEAVLTESDRHWTSDLPSWCPDWAGPWKEARELVDTVRAESVVWRPAGDTQATFTTMSRTTLGLKGLPVGMICDCSTPWTLSHNEVRENRQELLGMQDFILKLSSIVPVAQLWRLYFDVLLAPREHDAADVRRELYPDSPDHYTNGDVMRDIGPVWLQLYAEKMYRKAGYARNKRRRQSDLDLAVELLGIMCWRSRNTRLIVTDNGCLGTASEGSQVGDRVCVLYGGKAVYILRPQTDGIHHTYIGEAYVFGLMDGEALDAGFRESDFLLQ